ncbi:hypothetical protein ADIMK_0599 [Marinobacterium lacunae]|uniref:Uncharacterized protein n=1 Tax=Marinobacterium lacunae TaxID=1232683 RepID=A0A081G292_9GAMM|nr:hypothetical protein [Marinobacterium lacunae]KEA64897.1 hypothetical protein ADIMK_0599 [Marinobacterium lacunae]
MYSHRLLLIIALLTALLGPYVLELWLFDSGPWYRPFLIWLALCMLVALIEQWHRHDL